MTRALVLWADSRSANYGVRVLAAGAAELAKRAWGPDTVVEFQDYGPGDSPVSFGAKSIIADVTRRRRDITQRIDSFDVILDTGAGDSFADIYGYKRLMTMMNAARIANGLGIPRVVTPQTVGPFDKQLGRTLGKWSLRHASLVVARDSASARYCADLGRTVDLLASDMVFALPPEIPDAARDVILNVSGLLWEGNSHTDNRKYQNSVLKLIGALAADGRRVSLLAHVIGSKHTADDVFAINEILTRTDVEVEVLIPSDLSEARRYLASARVVVGSRMHACLNALSQGVPAISWAYSRKFAPLMGDLGWKYVVDLGEATDPVSDTMQQLALVADHPMSDLRAKADIHVDNFVSELAAIDLGRRGRGVRTAQPHVSVLPDPVRKVVDGGNCSGCGSCTLIYPGLNMELSTDGFLRPSADLGPTKPPHSSAADEMFKAACPGVTVVAPTVGKQEHPVFGRYADAWEAHATDPRIRMAGSSGGVLTALSTWLIESGRVDSVAGVTGAAGRTVPLELTSREDAIAASGSRYAPASSLAGLGDLTARSAMVGKPCEASALRQMTERSATDGTGDDGPIILSFFCAGTPSQRATAQLVKTLGLDPGTIDSVRYRGRGWPGEFVAHAPGVDEVRMSYHQSWGKHLGRDLQPVCKICPDGTGGSADISVGDFWLSDDNGFPLFADAPGSSVAIARTPRGVALIEEAVAAGVIVVGPIDLDAVAAVQPLQTERRLTLAARLLGRRAAFQPVPKYRGFGLTGRLIHHRWRGAPRVAAGTFVRTIKAVAAQKRSHDDNL